MNELARPEFAAARPWLALYLLLLAGLAAQQAWAHARHFQGALAARFGPALSPWRLAAKWLLLAGAGWQLLLALATPLGPPVKVESEAAGADVILAVDVSSSMYAQDVPPNRLLALKAALAGFTARLGGDRVGIVAFAGQAVIACPLTTDYDTAALFLEKLESDSVPRDGTGLGPALKLCLDGFAADPRRGRLIVLASDGEDTLDSDTEAQARRAGEMGVPVHTLGVGTPQGGMIPGRPDIFGRVMAKMYKGQPVISKLNPAALKKIASLSGGEYFAGASPQAMAAAYERVRALKQGGARAQDAFVREPLYQEPLLWAFLLLWLEAMLSVRSGGLGQAASRARGWALALWRRRKAAAGLLLLASSAQAHFLDPGRSEHDQGNAQYRQGDYEGAAQAYQASVSQNARRASSHYNLGNARFMQGDYPGAIAGYEEALRLDPHDEDAKFNLELARKKMEQRQGQPGQGGKGQQGRQEGRQKGAGQKQQSSGGSLSQDQIHAMMNMLKNDQRRFGGAFQPLKKRGQEKQQDPIEQLFQQMTGRPLNPQEEQGGGGDRKDW